LSKSSEDSDLVEIIEIREQKAVYDWERLSSLWFKVGLARGVHHIVKSIE
jgi:hypothetical protein